MLNDFFKISSNLANRLVRAELVLKPTYIWYQSQSIQVLGKQF